MAVAAARSVAAQACQSLLDCGANFDPCTDVSCIAGTCVFAPHDCTGGDVCCATPSGSACIPSFQCVH